MKQGPTWSVLSERLRNLGPSLGGVFSYSDLFNLIGTGSAQQNKRIIKRLVREGLLFKIQRGFYTTRDPDLWVLGCRLNEKAVISMDSVMAKNLLIGTIPARSVSLVSPVPGRRIIKTPFGLIRYFSMKRDLLFGNTRLPNGVAVAESEKAYVDLLYFYVKGARFVIDPLTDVDRSRLNRKKLETTLRRYRNPKFVAFVRRLIHEDA